MEEVWRWSQAGDHEQAYHVFYARVEELWLKLQKLRHVSDPFNTYTLLSKEQEETFRFATQHLQTMQNTLEHLRSGRAYKFEDLIMIAELLEKVSKQVDSPLTKFQRQQSCKRLGKNELRSSV